MVHTLENIARFAGNYRYYRKIGFYVRDAWHMAQMTLPER